jgi:hypothetical protein
MSTAPTLPRKGRVGELEERIDVLMIVEAQPQQLVLPTPFVDCDGTHPQALRRLSRREYPTDLSLRLVAVPPSALKGGLPPCVGDMQLTGGRRCRSRGEVGVHAARGDSTALAARCRTPQRLDVGPCLMQHRRNPGQVYRFGLGHRLSHGLLQALNLPLDVVLRRHRSVLSLACGILPFPLIYRN